MGFRVNGYIEIILGKWKREWKLHNGVSWVYIGVMENEMDTIIMEYLEIILGGGWGL